jgi:hypothetical protein
VGKLLLSLTLMFWWVMQLVIHATAPVQVLTGLSLMMTTLLFTVAFSHFVASVTQREPVVRRFRLV